VRPSVTVLALSALLGCAAPAPLTPPERGALSRDARKESPRWLQVSALRYQLADGSSPPALAPLPPSEWEVGDHPPPPGQLLEGVIPAGTSVRILRVDFPVGNFGQRTARRDTYVRLALGTGEEGVLLLDGKLGTEVAFWDELERWLTPLTPAAVEEGWNEAVRAAVKEKRTVSEMPAQAVVAAWGYPRTRQVHFLPEGRRETWVWAGGLRTAEFQDGRLVESRAPDATGTVP
jgi:hypothetical protein